jgi:hypothetical protein
MTTRDENAARLGTEAAGEQTCQRQANHSPATARPQLQKLNPKSKRAAILRAFLDLGARGMNCFEAALRHHDFVLRTTVSECSRYHGIHFNKRFEQVPGHNGSNVDCVRYSLTAEGAAKARELLGESLELAV